MGLATMDLKSKNRENKSKKAAGKPQASGEEFLNAYYRKSGMVTRSKKLWGDFYRVNVFTQVESITGLNDNLIAESYFVKLVDTPEGFAVEDQTEK